MGKHRKTRFLLPTLLAAGVFLAGCDTAVSYDPDAAPAAGAVRPAPSAAAPVDGADGPAEAPAPDAGARRNVETDASPTRGIYRFLSRY